ncbi:MAG: nuclear transport factor 2 family protein [Lacinutrix sp.]|uniref:nuclear transport factor 2 family protein n=1 Tax=Lacinutrix sp. TaxID=1937692 RepID=UPI0030A14CA2
MVLCVSTSIYAQEYTGTNYFRHLRYNHISPFIELAGIHPISNKTAMSTSHYIFNYDKNGKLNEIINNHYHTEKQHPLASIGVYKMVITYEGNIETRTFFDLNNKRITNDRQVYKEVFTYSNKGFKTKLDFYDLEDKPMESNWKISTYVWTKHKELIIERRYNLENQEVNVSPYFRFGTTGITLDKNGAPKAHYNLNKDLEITNNTDGIASYQDTYDSIGNHITYTYHNSKGALALNQWQFAIGEKRYDSIGNNTKLKQLDVDGKLIRERNVPSNLNITLSKIATKKNTIQIKEKALGYLISLQQLKPELMNEVMNDSLNKVTIGWDRSTKKEYSKRTTKAQMIEFSNSWNKSNTKFPTPPDNKVTILDIYNRIANVKLVSDNWVEYLHLMKLDGKWQIVNLIWQHKDVGKYPKE